MPRKRARESFAKSGLAGWLLARLGRRETGKKPRLEMLERIALAPRQTVALVEADGVRLLVATSGEGSPAFYRLNSGDPGLKDTEGREGRLKDRRKTVARVSW